MTYGIEGRIKLETNESDKSDSKKCNVTSYIINQQSDECYLALNKMSIVFEYRFCDGEFKRLNFINLNMSLCKFFMSFLLISFKITLYDIWLVTVIRLYVKMLATDENFLFYWSPAQDTIEFVRSGCNKLNEQLACADFLDLKRTSTLFRLIDPGDQKSTALISQC